MASRSRSSGASRVDPANLSKALRVVSSQLVILLLLFDFSLQTPVGALVGSVDPGQRSKVEWTASSADLSADFGQKRNAGRTRTPERTVRSLRHLSDANCLRGRALPERTD